MHGLRQVLPENSAEGVGEGTEQRLLPAPRGWDGAGRNAQPVERRVEG